MWSADRPRPTARGAGRHARCGGYTIAETMVVLGMVVLMSFFVERTLTSTREAEQRLAATRSLAERGQRTAFDLREMVSGSRKLFQDDDVGRAYLDALELDRDPLLPGARLPRFDETRPLGPDEVGDPRTGNVLLFVREGDAVAAVADAATRRVRRIDTYRFVCVFPSPTTRRLVFGDLPAVDLVVWRSAAYPSLAQIRAITDPTERQNVVADLATRFGHSAAWDVGAGVDDAFYAMDDDGTLAATPTADPTVPEDIAVSPRGRLLYAGLQLARTRADSLARSSLFSVDDPADWVAEGFEVKIAGPSGSRKVWIHLVVEAPAGQISVVVPNTLIASARDL